ncbi:hypothetical protein [Terribacillus saccharophilus]|uniref:hypothetical protein n=1 Tax=Terribacillus saccharophilus TaxID=361277 RepID=UPI003D2DE22A
MSKLYQWFWGDGIYYIFYVLISIAVIYFVQLVLSAPVKEKYGQWKYKYRLRKMRIESTVKDTDITHNGAFLNHIQMLINATKNEKSEQDVGSFFVTSMLLLVVTTVMTFIAFKDVVLAIALGFLIATIPYLFLQIKLRKIRSAMSGEFRELVQIIMQQYSANQHDMYYALKETQRIVVEPTLRKIITKLVNDLQTARNSDELRNTISVFVFTVGNSWAKRLGSIILKAYTDKENVLKTLMVLTRQMEDTEEMLEEEKTGLLDTVHTGYLTVPIFIASVALGYFVSGAQDWFNLQFNNHYTLLLFTTAAIGTVFSIIISLILKTPKNDL